MLRLYRTVRGQSLRDVAVDIGIGHATLMRIEHGQTFDVATWFKVWAWLDGDCFPSQRTTSDR
jgi:transcriptional regulator with XRE-family HTH domain